MIRSAINRFLGREPEKAPDLVPEPDLVATPDPRGAPGTRVHHEIFLGEPVDGKFPWLCRVYARNGAPNEKSGEADTEQAARNAALSWAAITKAALRGDA